MNSIYQPLLLLAQTNRFADMGRSFRPGGNNVDMGQFFFVSFILAVVTVGLWIFSVYYNAKNRKGYNNPKALFRELCKAHQIDFRSRLLLFQLSHWHQLSQPGRIFLEPEQFDPNNLSPALRQHQAHLLALRDRIFGQKLED